MTVRRALWIVLWLSVALLSGGSSACADVFGPSLLASNGNVSLAPGEGIPEQAQYAHDAAISGNGRYVVFDGAIGGISGVWRRDLQTSQVQPVAVGRQIPGSETCESAAAPCEALLPSISEDGTYVSFTTAAALAPQEDRNAGPDVYVRNMSIPVALAQMEAASPQACEAEGPRAVEPGRCAFTIASAVDGGAEGLSYEAGQTTYGAVASGRSAMSSDGRLVAFVTTSVSNLAGTNTPALQVAVRDVSARSTRLVSVERNAMSGQPIPGKPVSVSEAGTIYGAAFSPQVGPPAFPTSGYLNRPYAATPAVGASISGDGSTVAWMGRDISRQTSMLAAENRAPYTEPLLRRIADGPLAPTLRVTGGSEPENPACAASGETLLPGGGGAPGDPCQGPFAVEQATGLYGASAPNAVPQLSADGYIVAFLATAQLVERGANFGLGGDSEADDLYLVDMREHRQRKAVRALTELAGGSRSHAGTAPIVDFSVAPDGRQVAFSTQRIQFPLGAPTFVSQPAAVAGMAELFDIDLQNETLTRVTSSFEGGPAEHPHKAVISGENPYPSPADGAASPSFSADGNLLAYSATGSNLVYGDGNTPPVPAGIGSADGGDVFTVARKLFPSVPVEGYVSPAPPNPTITPEWRLGVTARSLSNGSVLLYVAVPAAGSLNAVAQGGVPVSAARARRARRRHGRRASTVLTRQLATAATRVRSGETVQELTLTPSPGYRALAERATGLSGTARIQFASDGRPRLTETIAVTFVRRIPAHRARRARTRSRHHR